MSETTVAKIEFTDKTLNWDNNALTDLVEYGVFNGWDGFMTEAILEKLKHISILLEESKKIQPPIDKVFRCMSVNPNDIKWVFLGLDPYSNGSAVGFSFSVKHGNRVNQSLRNIYSEIKNSGLELKDESGDITHWASQGAFLLNTALTIPHSAESGEHCTEWFPFTSQLITWLSRTRQDLIWLLCGSKASSFRKHILFAKKIIRTSHPSPRSAHKSGKYPAFMGSNCFKIIDREIGGFQW